MIDSDPEISTRCMSLWEQVQDGLVIGFLSNASGY